MTYKICVLGGGSWGTTIACHLFKNGHQVSLWEFQDSQVKQMLETRSSPLVPHLNIPEPIRIASDMKQALHESEIIFSVIPSQFVRSTWKNVKKNCGPVKMVVSLSKGIETESLMRMSQIIEEEFPHSQNKIAVVSGPSHAEEVSREIPTAVVVASKKESIAVETQKLLSSPTFRVYTNTDMIGIEICASLKNIFAIACGACDGLGLGDNTKAAIMTRGLNEMVRLGVKMGAKQNTFSGLAGIGDLIVTCFSKHSRNRLLGEKIGSGKNIQQALQEMTMVAEGYFTSKSVYEIIKKYDCDCPIMTELYKVLYEGKNIRGSVLDLMSRPMRGE